MEMIYSQNLFGRPYLVPPGVPADRVAALRKALAAMLEDKALLAEAEKSGLDIGPMGGEELQALVARLYALPPTDHRAGQAIADLQGATRTIACANSHLIHRPGDRRPGRQPHRRFPPIQTDPVSPQDPSTLPPASDIPQPAHEDSPSIPSHQLPAWT